ncbi:hypothetical protein CMUS01_12188 [Colletotrichum musicola]|uniref:Uncharacterized protein n=1 Tax=Colletotrichum musicola TaxID=2175873 RepID=A0A8H6N2A0_9PEZI|nr:hypothetical protein CMUS01_12188 [Colletotrichum musicola]
MSSSDSVHVGDDGKAKQTVKLSMSEILAKLQALEASHRSQQEELERLRSEVGKGKEPVRLSPTLLGQGSITDTTSSPPARGLKMVSPAPNRATFGSVPSIMAWTPPPKSDYTIEDASDIVPPVRVEERPADSKGGDVLEECFKDFRLKMPKEHFLKGTSNWLAWSTQVITALKIRSLKIGDNISPIDDLRVGNELRNNISESPMSLVAHISKGLKI